MTQTDAVPASSPAVPVTSAGELLTETAANPRKDAWRLFRRNKAAMFGLGWAILMVFVAVFANFIQRYDPQKIDVPSALSGPSRKHWLGTDILGRDLWSRIVRGARFSLTLSSGVVVVSLILSLIVGGLAGFRGGWFDSFFMRLADAFLALPYIVVVVAFTGLFGRSIWSVIVAIVAIGWMSVARLFHGSVLQVRSLDFIEAARASGASTSRILRRHVFSNAIQPVIVSIGFSIGGAILTEATLSFLGIGIDPGTPTWGTLVSESRQYITSSSHLFFFPAGTLALTVLAFSFIGDGVRDALDPKLRGF